MEINELNYEGFAIDYAEGNLSGETLVAMELFLSKNPDIQEEILAICATTLPIEQSVVFSDKAKLLKQPTKISYLKIGFAISSAACLVLAFGFVWMLTNQNNYGELAYKTPTINIQTDVRIAIPEEKVEDTAVSEIINPINPISPKNNKTFITEFYADEGSKTELVEDNISVIELVADEQNIESDKIKVEEQEIEHVKLLVETKEEQLELEELSTSTENAVNEEDLVMNNHAIDLSSLPVEYVSDSKTKNKSNKSARRRAIKGSLWGVFQQSFIPEGVSSLASN